MLCICDQKEILEFKVEGDVGADPIWCSNCGCNLELEDFPLSKGLSSELMEWSKRYGEWIDWDQDQLIPNGMKMEKAHNRQGAELTEKVQKELGGKYRIKFSSSTMASMYANK